MKVTEKGMEERRVDARICVFFKKTNPTMVKLGLDMKLQILSKYYGVEGVCS